VLAQLQKEFTGDLRIAYRHFPLSSHDKAQLAVQAAEAAGKQGKFWEMHDLLFEQRSDWIDLTLEEFPDWLVEQAGGLEMDVDQFTKDFNSTTLVKIASEAWEKNAAIGLPGTPFLVINGYPYNGPVDFGSLEATIRMILLEKRQYSECPPMTIDPDKQYYATLRTAKGEIKIELFAEQAPLAVNSFVFLARNGWFNGVTFHRVIPGFVAQAGDPSGSGYGGPGYAFDNEIVPGLKFNGPGVVAMANAGPGSNGSQFFITYASSPNLDGGYTIFGRVVTGMDILVKLTPRDPSQNLALPPGDQILSVVIEEK
jgi:cyclophilin family peptidyl-prolyl cis-trans isomerase